MADLLLELFSEEIPARMQARAAEDLKKRVTDALVAEGFLYEGAVSFVTPRRLTLSVHGLPKRGKDVREEKKGPRVGAPQQAIDGFLKSAGLTSLDQATIESDPKKGDFYVAITEKPGRATTEALASLLPGILRSFPWPKSMRWGASSGPAGKSYVNGEGRGAETLTWVRPLQAILCLFGEEQEEPEVVDFAIDGIRSGNVTFGHRFLSDAKPIAVKRLDDYVAKLEKAKVIADPKRRRDTILHEARQLCFAQGLELVEDEGLADEVAGLVEWPVPLMGSFEDAFLEVPEEVIRTTIRANQKCFVVRDPKTGKLTNRFIATANTIATDGGALIIAGNARVIRARLSDARFFWETDKKVKLETRLEKLKTVRFHEKLGTQYERVERIAALAAEIAPSVGADPKLARKAAMLAKADLATEMVGEFPELQGFMGHRYALLEGHEPSVGAAIEDHYRPQGPSDRVPTDPVSIAVALADKLDILVGFWAIDEKPTGSKDPYALRRAALGVIRLLVENGVSIRLRPMIVLQLLLGGTKTAIARKASDQNEIRQRLRNFDPTGALNLVFERRNSKSLAQQFWELSVPEFDKSAIVANDLLSFFHDRLKVMLKDQGARHDLVDAVLGAGGNSDDLLSIVQRVQALSAFLATEDGTNLLAGYRRAANILKAEEKKDGAIAGAVDAAALKEPEEKALADMLAKVEPALQTALAADDYQGAMQRMATLRPAVDAFFDKILVNADDAALRLNRLRLLSKLRAATAGVADLSRIAG